MRRFSALVGVCFGFLALASQVEAAEEGGFWGSVPIIPIIFLIILLAVGLGIYFFYLLPKKKASQPQILPPEEEKKEPVAKEAHLGTTANVSYKANMANDQLKDFQQTDSSFPPAQKPEEQGGKQPQTQGQPPGQPVSQEPPVKPPPGSKPPEPAESLGKKKLFSPQVALGLALVFLLISIPLAVIIVKQRTSYKGKAVGESCTKDEDCGDTSKYYCGGGTCKEKIDSAADGIGGCCDPGASGERGCPEGQTCDIPNGACMSGKSCNTETGTHLECRDSQCVYVPGAGENLCESHEECRQEATPTPGGDPCIEYGYIHDDTCTANPYCETDPLQNGFCCKTEDGTRFFCCYRNGNCQEGLTPGDRFCRDNNNGSVTIGCTKAGQVKVITHDCTSSPKCPCSEGPEEHLMDVVKGENTFSLAQFNIRCGQIDIDATDFCGSCADCKDWGCNGGGGTPTPPTGTATPPTGTVTPSEAPRVCVNLFAFIEEDGALRKLTTEELSNLEKGTRIKLGTLKVAGSEAAKFQIWKEGSKLREMTTITYQSVGGSVYYMVDYTVPDNTGSYSVYAWIKVGDIYR